MPKPKVALNVPLMDEDHAQIEAMLAQAARTADKELPALLRVVEAETRAHFDREQVLMEAAAVPILPCHVAQHRLLLAEFARGHDAAARGDMAALRAFLERDLTSLIAAHVDGPDRVTASFLRKEISAESLGVLRLPVGA